MADLTCNSIWKITHGSTVLLDFTDRLTAEPDFSFDKEVEVSPMLEGENVAIFDRGNVSHELSYSRVVRKADMTAAREWRMSHDVVVSALVKGILTIEFQGGDSYTLTDAVVQSMTTSTGKDVSGHSLDVMAEYSIIGGKLEIV